MPFEGGREEETKAIVKLKERLSGFETEQGRMKGLSYSPRPEDVVITTTPKAGTTWMQQICHQLRTGGDMEFDEISRVVPWLELAEDQGQDLEADQVGVPRLFKTHAWADHCPPFGRAIVVLRDPMDVLLSFYRFFEGWFFEPGSLTLDAFADQFWLARDVPTSKMQNASYFVHLISWYKRRQEDGVLLVCFEDLKEDLRSQVERVARFLSTPQHDLLPNVDVAVQHSTFEFMKAHESQFDEKLSKLARNEACGLPKDAGLRESKVKDGAVGKGALTLSPRLRERIAEKWRLVVEPVTGCSTYSELRHQLKSESRN